MASAARLGLLPFLGLKSDPKHGFGCRVRVRSLRGYDEKGASVVGERGSDDGKFGANVAVNEEKKRVKKKDGGSESLKPLWDDGYGTNSVNDYFQVFRDVIKPDGGPPRWFCPVECGSPLNDSPALLFLPGLDGTRWGLILHHKALGKVFEVRYLHIPVYDRTPFEAVRLEHRSSPDKPIYLVGDSLGGCLALAVAARNPTIDVVLVLVNPATPFGRSQLQHLLPILEALPDELYMTAPYLLSFVMGDPVKMSMVNVGTKLPPTKMLEQLSTNLIALLPHLSLLKSSAAYANSRFHAVEAEVLVLASGKDNMIPSDDEGQRLMKSLKNCKARSFKDNGHTLLLEDSINLLTAIKGTCKYRRRSRNRVVTFSTLEDGSIVRGLSGVPSEGPVLFVANHNLLGLEVYALVEEFLREKNIMVRTAAHPESLIGKLAASYGEFSYFDWISVGGAFPVSPTNLFKLLSTKSHVLLYPGGVCEAFHLKGEVYTLFWPEQEFVRMAARFGATIVPFAAVGEDDLVNLVLDYNDLMKIPIINDFIRGRHLWGVPGMVPKVPGRVYLLFGKSIETKGRGESLKNPENANELYQHIESQIEANIAYLLKKRGEDPYRSIIDRTLYRALDSPPHQVPSFKP